MLTPDEHFRLFGAVSRMEVRRARGTGRRLASLPGWRPRRGIVVLCLSGGTRQRLNVVLAEPDGPGLTLLGESYQGFDENPCLILRSQSLRRRDRGTGVLMIMHMLYDLDDINRVIELYPRENL